MKHYLKHLVCIVLIVTLLRGGQTFAADTNSLTETTLKGINTVINPIIMFFSRVRVLLAIGASKLMSNELIYGSILKLDTYLWTIWNVMKNIANFIMGFMVLFMTLRYLLFLGESPVKLIPKLLLAGILVNMSRFIVGALLDIATIATSGVGGFVNTVFNDSAGLGSQLSTELNSTMNKIPKKSVFVLDAAKNNKQAVIQEPQTQGTSVNDALQLILPKANSISWPLLYMGYSIFRFQDFVYLDGSQASQSSIFINNILKLMMVLMFAVPLLSLFFLNLMRVFYLRIFIAFSPIIFLLKAITKEGKSAYLPGRMNYGEMVSLIFQPVISVAVLSVSLVFLIGISGMMKANDTLNNQNTLDLGGAQISLQGNTSSITYDNNLGKTEIIGGVFKESQTNLGFIGDMILMIFAGFLLRTLTGITFKRSGEIGKKIEKEVQEPLRKLGETAVSAAPILPGGFTFWSVQKAMREIPESIPGIVAKPSNATFDTLNDQMKKALGIVKTFINPRIVGDLNKYLTTTYADKTKYLGGTSAFFSKIGTRNKSIDMLVREDAFAWVISNRFETYKWSKEFRESFLALSPNLKNIERELFEQKLDPWKIKQLLNDTSKTAFKDAISQLLTSPGALKKPTTP